LAFGGCSVDQLAITDVFGYLAIQSGTRFECTLRLFQHEYRGKLETYWEFWQWLARQQLEGMGDASANPEKAVP
jgi:hypothetical protein